MENSSNTDPLVSICIPVYNAEATIKKTLESITTQTYRNLEIIVVDNRSTDRTLDEVRQHDDPRVRIVENPVHFRSAEDNWNSCFAHTTGEFIALFHADDLYSPETVARQVMVFKKNPSVSGVFTKGIIIDENDQATETFWFPREITGNKPLAYCELLPIILAYGNVFLCPSAMVRSSIYQEMAPFRYDQFGSAADLDMWLRVAAAGPVVILDDQLLRYRVSRMQWSFGLRKRTRESDGFRALDYHIGKNGNDCSLSPDSLGRYELRRMEDQIFCALNFLKKRDLSDFAKHWEHMPWGKFFRIIITKPRISLPVLYRGCFKVWRNIMPVKP